jgi:5-methyltetrahydrofolate--homocysteine methyltransferase
LPRDSSANGEAINEDEECYLVSGLMEMLERAPILGDGAMGTMLQQEGLPIGQPPDLLNLECPEIVTGVHARYREAGCDYLETNTFGANRIKLSTQGLEARLSEIIARGVDLARGAAGETCLVAGSVGPTGTLLEPYGDTPLDQVRAAFGETGMAMDRAGVDFFLVETMTDLNEAVAAIEAIKAVSRRPIVATAVFSQGRKGFRTLMGNAAADAAAAMVAAGATLVGTNCCSGMAEAAGIMEAMVAGSAAAVVAQPNAGIPRVEGDRLVYPQSPQAMGEGVPRLLAAGVRMIGGCCGTTPEHIRAIGAAMGRA